jgi:hypothetical protein
MCFCHRSFDEQILKNAKKDSAKRRLKQAVVSFTLKILTFIGIIVAFSKITSDEYVEVGMLLKCSRIPYQVKPYRLACRDCCNAGGVTLWE